MFRYLQQKKGQSVTTQYVMVIFVAMGAIIAMMTYTQRGIQARLRDANIYMIDSVKTTSGKPISYEYEPYYGNVVAQVARNEEKTNRLLGGLPGSSGDFRQWINQVTNVLSVSTQAPPKAGD